MTHTVEMAWGRPWQGSVYEYADDGRLVGLTVFRSLEAPDPERRRFSCSSQAWHASLALGRKYGWLPMGTVPAARCIEGWAERGDFDNGYYPEEWAYAKQVRGTDAAALADALERALKDPAAAPIVQALRPARRCTQAASDHAALEPSPQEFLRKFVAFLRMGPLVFAWADPPKTGSRD